ncbi:hypothetical protein [Methylobacterium oryzisoli]|uniref:hypothetical protein n=1 Tax=Methylobacterium oryzisoli TaxID=3385502 RepID=UPI00389176DD
MPVSYSARLRRGLARHRPRPVRPHDRSLLRTTDVVLALAGLALLGSLTVWAAIALATGAPAP